MDSLLPWRVRVAAMTTFAACGAFVLVDALALRGDILFYRTASRLLFAPLFLLVGALASGSLGRRAPQLLVIALATLQALQLSVTGVWLPPSENVGFFPALLFYCAYLPLPLRRCAIMAGSFVAAFLAVSFGAHLWPAAAIIKHAGNLLAASVVGVICARMAEMYARGEFLAKRELAEANRHLEEARRVKDQFFTDVSHELRTPLTTALLALEGTAEEAKAAVRPLHRLQKLVDELLLLARIDAGAGRASDEVTDVVAAIRRIVVEFSSGFTGKGLRLAAELPGESLPVKISADALERVAVNLIGNALKYTPDGGKVIVRVTSRGSEVELEVQDDGPGIAREDLARIFDRFVRVESRAGAPGIGVGLSIARELTELYGGRISCESELGYGTRFFARWPRCAAPPAAAHSPHARVQEAMAAALDGELSVPRAADEAPPGAPCVLVIEDHRDLAERIANSLGPTLRVAIVHDGLAGVNKAKELRPDLIVCDVLLPSLGGHDVCRQLRANPSTSATPILLLSALADREHILAGLQAGADDTMAKPFDAGMLRARVEALLRLKRRRDEAGQMTQVLQSFCQGMALALGYDAAVLLARGLDGSFVVSASGGTESAFAGEWGPADAGWAQDRTASVLTGRTDAPAAIAQAALAVAAPVEAEPRGALVFISLKARKLRADEKQIVAAAAACAAVMLERERSVGTLAQLADEKQRLSSAIISGQDAERRRLALELHDGPGQTLVAALLHLDIELRVLGPREELSRVRMLAAQALADLRAVTRDLHPPSLAQHGLLRTLQTLAEQVNGERMQVSCEMVPSLPVELPTGTALGLFRISQAALTNAVRHAHASRAVLRLSLQPGLLILEVEDDGVGFIPSRTEHGVGLPGMRERATSLGGQLVIESDLGQGTKVRASVPFPFQG